jgi:(2Fe-2S) ferredoxin
MPRYRLAVCKGPDCREGGADSLYQAVRSQAIGLGITSELCEVARGGCYGLCHLGPNVVVREARADAPPDPMRRGDFQLLYLPGEVHYWKMDAARCGRVLAEHIKEGKPVKELVCPPEIRPDKR